MNHLVKGTVPAIRNTFLEVNRRILRILNNTNNNRTVKDTSVFPVVEIISTGNKEVLTVTKDGVDVLKIV